MASVLDYLSQGSRIFYSSFKSRIRPKQYEGSADQICHQIVKECWNGRFFQTSTTNFPQFWTRDFGWCVQSLIDLKYEKEVHQTIRYALNRFKKYKKITTTITPGGKPFDFPTMAVDSLPWFIHSIRVSNASYYSYRHFLNAQINAYFKKVINPQTGLVKPDVHFSSIKDFAIRKSSCYDNCMVALLARDLSRLKLDNPFKKYDYSELLQRHFWNGHYFYDDLQKKHYVAGDANVFPFLFGLEQDKTKRTAVLKALDDAGLTKPFPLKYTNSRSHASFIWQEAFMRDYESDAIWMHLGLLYGKLLKMHDPEAAAVVKKRYQELIETYHNFLEVFDSQGKPFKTSFYHCDSGMLWAANYLTL
ncbi:hypothetical protein COV20_00590 [Candidatus Woesearchaeota archaeon CG10_big_fil_rev_8_21_14_0_10_45_16]|nr:MAG: hypothetical protein COV20_00590 [Candidatus Woesearchaeota archaeon CG10_big_fil_rev_8_21_14_0_10_45_16]